MSSDASAQPVALWVALLPSLVGLALALLLPPRAPALPVNIGRKKPLLISTALLLLLALLFPLLATMLPLLPEDQILVKFVMLIVLPAIVVISVRKAVGIKWARAAWRWWAPAVVVVVWTVLSQMMPWSPSLDLAGLDPTYVIVAALATAITAGIGEELFYRRWLQTRLEALVGPWAGVGLASLAFALMHFTTHWTGDFVLDVATMIVFQGTFGVFLGVVWMRYRNLSAIILVHLPSPS